MNYPVSTWIIVLRIGTRRTNGTSYLLCFVFWAFDLAFNVASSTVIKVRPLEWVARSLNDFHHRACAYGWVWQVEPSREAPEEEVSSAPQEAAPPVEDTCFRKGPPNQVKPKTHAEVLLTRPKYAVIKM
eukprot:575184-Amphidinium_carterae.1